MDIVYIGDGSKKHHSAEAIGSKAANLVRVAALGLPVPPAFVLPVKHCAAIIAGAPHAERRVIDGLSEGIAFLEAATGKRFGDRRNPLLVSVRSGAAKSMPGMLDTVLDVGCTAAAVRGLIRMTGNPRFAWDCRRRFLESFAQTVLGIAPAPFAARLSQVVAAEDADSERDLDGEALERLAGSYQAVIEDHDEIVPDDPMQQLLDATRAVYRSWMSDRAQTYRRLQHLEALHGTAVTVQAMVFGNRGMTSAAGVAFSRDPSTGANEPVIDVLRDAQGEDVVSGRRTPQTNLAMPALANELRDVLTRLEREFGDVQDIEFTIEDGKLWILQTRAAKRTPRAALRFAIDMVHENLISREEALRRLDDIDLDALTYAHLLDASDPAGHGIGTSGGVAVGRLAFNSESGKRLAAGGDAVILARPDTNTADIAGFAVAAGILTATGGRTAHAALVARQLGKPCIVGCASLAIDPAAHRARLGEAAVEEGDWVTIDGDTGNIYLGQREIVTERPTADLSEVESWRAGAAIRSAARR